MVFLGMPERCRLLVALLLLIYLPGWTQSVADAPIAVLRTPVADTTTSPLAKRIHALHDRILAEGRMASQLNNETLTRLPIGIAQNVGGLAYVIAIDSAVFTSQGAFFNAYLSLEIPATGDRVAFAATNIAFHPNGLARASTSNRLVLVQDYALTLSKQVTMNLTTADRRNFVEWNCAGFQSINLKGNFEFSNQLLVPDSPDGKPGSGTVKAGFEVANLRDWGSLLVHVDIPPFQLPSLAGVSFAVRNAWVDYSDLANPDGMLFPTSYANTYGSNPTLWQGFYLQAVGVKLPGELHKQRKQIDAANLIIDNRGVSGFFGARNLLGYEEGDLEGWPFSIDSLGVQLQCSQLSGAAFSGRINVPLFEESQPLRYRAFMTNDQGRTDYGFAVRTTQTLTVPLLVAEAELKPNSEIRVVTKNGKLRPEALLHGVLHVGAPLGSSGSKAQLNGLAFQDLYLSTEHPYVRGGVFSLNGLKNHSLAGFPLSLDSLSLRFQDGRAMLTVGAKLNLTEKIPAATTVNIFGKLESVTEGSGDAQRTRQKWTYDKTTLSAITIGVDEGAFSFQGTLQLYDGDPTFGNGFRGEIQARFQPIEKLTATAQFGNVRGMRYWYVDAKALMSNGLPIAPGFGLYGFGGGMYYRMKRKDVPATNATASISDAIPGATRSGIQYVPDSTMGLGLKAAVTIGTSPKPDPFNADAGFELAFNQRGGLRYANFQGEGYFMTPLAKRSASAPLYAALNVNYDTENQTLHANLDTYVNVGGVLRGSQNGQGLAGSAVMHFAPDKWYIYIGTPDARVGLNFLNFVKTGGYFMVRTEIPAMPAPPAVVSSILGDMDLDFMRNESALRRGAGFAFGANLEVGSPQRKYLGPFYGQFHVGAGFDIMLKDYGEARCEGNSSPLGINGWYASGQAYAFLQGAIGIRVNMFFINGEFDILRIGAAAALQAKLPNPAWLRGVAGGEFSILGGLVKGKCRFQVTVGEECKIEGGSALEGVKVISQMSPANSEGEVSVFNAPQVAFNIAIDKAFETLDGDNNYQSYRARLKEFKVICGGRAVAGTLEWNEAGDVVVFKPTDILPPKTSVTASVKVYWEKKENGAWRPLGNGNQVAGETAETQFTTGLAPNHIDAGNVRYSYPLAQQYHFLKGESPGGYLQLVQGQDDLFQPMVDGKAWKFVTRFTPPGSTPGPALEVPLSYDAEQNLITYPLPPQLANEQVYAVSFVRLPATANEGVDQNVTQGEKTLVASGDSNRVSTNSKSIAGSYTNAQEKNLYESRFRTSRFNTFVEKMNALSVGNWADHIEGTNLLRLGLNVEGPETFDAFEIKGSAATAPLIELRADAANPWLRDHLGPQFYNAYPRSNDLKLGWREPQVLGTPPLKAVFIRQSPDDQKLAAEGVDAPPLNTGAVFTYDLSYYTFQDYYELAGKAADLRTQGRLSAAGWPLLGQPYRELMPGTYRFTLSYVLPGRNIVTSRKEFTLSW